MKRINKLIIYIFAFGMASCFLGLNVKAVSFGDLNTGKLNKISESKIVEDMGNGIIKEEMVVVKHKDYNFESGIKLNDRYICVEVFDSYKEKANDKKNQSQKSAIAVSTFNVNFRYNDTLNIAECLSVSRGSLSNDKNTKITSFSRRINQKKDLGAGIIKTTLTNGNTSFQKKCIIKCDEMGNISVC